MTTESAAAFKRLEFHHKIILFVLSFVGLATVLATVFSSFGWGPMQTPQVRIGKVEHQVSSLSGQIEVVNGRVDSAIELVNINRAERLRMQDSIISMVRPSLMVLCWDRTDRELELMGLDCARIMRRRIDGAK